MWINGWTTMNNCKIYFFLLMIVMGQQIKAQTALPQVLQIPEEIDPVKVSLESRADELLNRLSLHGDVDAAAVMDAIRSNLNLTHAGETDLDMQIVKSLDRGTYTIHNLIFQSLPGVYVPANLYVPKGKGPFPAILNSHGHWPPGRRSEIVQRTAQILASNGYVCLSMDAMGSGERGRMHQHEYHGANLGSLLLDLGTPLMGVQLLENQRAIDLLCSLDYVDKDQIGATGASGGGNQTMWLAAVEPRVRAAVPVVSVGTFRSYIMNSNCVCELHPKGLLHFEEGQLLQTMAPKAVKIITALRDGNAAFNVHQMLKSYRLAKLSYEEQGLGDKLDYALFDEPHSYTDAMNETMVQWFNKSFNYRTSSTVDISLVQLLDTSSLSVLQHGVERNKIITIPQFIQREFGASEKHLFSEARLDAASCRTALRQLLSSTEPDTFRAVKSLEPSKGWQRLLLETTQGQLIPVLLKKPSGEGKNIYVVFPSQGKEVLSAADMDRLLCTGDGVAVVDLYGLGERASATGDRIDGALPRFHTLSRSLLWLGQTMMGLWADEIRLVSDYMQQHYPAHQLIVQADSETAVAALVSSSLAPRQNKLQLRHLLISYLPGPSGGLDNYNMAVHIPGILRWGDIPLLLALSSDDVYIDDLLPWAGKACSDRDNKELVEKVNAYKRKLHMGGTLQINE